MKEKKPTSFSSIEKAMEEAKERKIRTGFDNKGKMELLPKRSQSAKASDNDIISVNNTIDYACRNENAVRQVVEVDFPSKYGHFRLIMYESVSEAKDCHLVMVKGHFNGKNPILVRIHSECLTGDMLGSLRCDCGDQLYYALQRIEQEGCGAVLYLRQEGRGIGLKNKLLAYKLQEEGKDTVEANEALGFKADLREYWLAVQILKDLGIQHIRLMTNNPKKIEDITRYGIEVVERIPVIINSNPMNKNYLRAKKEKLGHLLHF